MVTLSQFKYRQVYLEIHHAEKLAGYDCGSEMFATDFQS